MGSLIGEFLTNGVFASGSGDGSASGSEYGYGIASGSASGSASASGSGDGSESGIGSGSGYGIASASGSGYGDGSGEKLTAHRGKKVYYVDDIPCTFVSCKKTSALVDAINKKDYSIKRMYIAKVNGFFAHGETLKQAIAEAEKKHLASLDIEERKQMFLKQFPKYAAEYATADLYAWHSTITGSCESGKEMWVKENGVSLDSTMTVKRFCELTKNAYGSQVIREIEEMYP